jgi:protein-S-isoprenylcysteine O-methyltransferase Ste14
MTDSADPGTMSSPQLAQPEGDREAGPTTHKSFHGRPISWISVSTIMLGFLLGALGLILDSHGPTWWLFWTGVGLTVLGLLLVITTRTMDDWY